MYIKFFYFATIVDFTNTGTSNYYFFLPDHTIYSVNSTLPHDYSFHLDFCFFWYKYCTYFCYYFLSILVKLLYCFILYIALLKNLKPGHHPQSVNLCILQKLIYLLFIGTKILVLFLVIYLYILYLSFFVIA